MSSAAPGARAGIATGPFGSQRLPDKGRGGRGGCPVHPAWNSNRKRSEGGLTVQRETMRDARRHKRARPPGEGGACCYPRLRGSPFATTGAEGGEGADSIAAMNHVHGRRH